MTEPIHQYGIFEFVLHPCSTEDPYFEIMVDFEGPGDNFVQQPAFWDGGKTWKVRFSPGAIGRWHWRSRCLSSHTKNFSIESGSFECTAYQGENPLYRHGPLCVAPDRRSFQHQDGTPIFWLGDTAWNGVIRSDEAAWQHYLEIRRGQGFNLIQFVITHWRGDALDEMGEKACYGSDPIQINPAFFQRLDHKVAMINAVGMFAMPVLLWSCVPGDVGYALSESDATRLAAYVVSRYDAYQLVWLLGGDGNYHELGIERWKRIGRSVFRSGHDRLASMHPGGQMWVGDDFRTEDWYDLIGYQSGHGDSREPVAWLVTGPPAQNWQQEPTLPVINLEPNYETAFGYQHHTQFNDFHVRRAAYWSLLVHPGAGLSYGHDAIWNWNTVTGPAEGHAGWHGDAIPPWHTGLFTEGIRCLSLMKRLMETVDWRGMLPFQEALAVQPGDQDIYCYTAVSQCANGSLLIYSPCGGDILFSPDFELPQPMRVIDPRSGESSPAQVDGQTVHLPKGSDWLVFCGTPSSSGSV